MAAGQNADGRLEVFARGTDNALIHSHQESPGGPWSKLGFPKGDARGHRPNGVQRSK